MAQNSRQQQILDLVRQRGFMSIEALADALASHLDMPALWACLK